MIGEADKAKLHVGFKQTVRALSSDNAAKVFLAADCDSHMQENVKNLAAENNTPLELVPSMKELGEICSIDLGASCAVILK